jgi:hypothetical protein
MLSLDPSTRFHTEPHARLVSTTVSFFPPLTLAFATFRLAQRHAAFLTVRHEKALLSHVTQHALALYLFAKAFEQFLL